MRRCDLCGRGASVVRVEQVLGNEAREVHLCEDCARTNDIGGSGKEFEGGFGFLVEDLFRNSGQDDAVCPRCVTSLKDVQTTGKAGCPQCYFVFSAELTRLLNLRRNELPHRGAVPRRLEPFRRLLIEKEELRQNLQHALDREDYERAVAIRDRLRDIEHHTGI